MKNKPPKSIKKRMLEKRERELSREEEHAWLGAMYEVNPLWDEDEVDAKIQIETQKHSPEKIAKKTIISVIVKEGRNLPAPESGLAKLDKHIDRKVRRGDLPIDARLDLHGNTQQQAREKLERFIEREYASGSRLVLVITGKGRKEGEGILRSSLPRWIKEEYFANKIAGYEQARQKDGGQGAFYLYLRRHDRIR